ncbi:MAG: YceI family protein [Alphaproteobacteria bacterium]|nr:YceI family protein [Alphaproteobacteria bacterium]
MRRSILLLAFTLAACGAPNTPGTSEAPPAEAPVEHTAPAGAYTLDKAHSSLIVRMSHLGYSQFTARFETWDATMNLDPANPENSNINVTIDPRSIASDNPPTGFIDIMRNDFLKAREFPQVTFRSTAIEQTGPNTARVTGDLTLLGVTHPVTLEARFNGGYEGMQLDPHARVGLSAHGTFNRSEFGMAYGIPPEGTNMGVGDAVEVIIETEFSGPAWTAPSAPTP